MSLDPPFVAEFANAGFLRPFSKQDEPTFTNGVLKGPLETVYWNDQLVAAPFWANTQLLWFRKSAAKAAGVDPTAPDFTWDQMIKAAEGQHKVIGVQANRYEGYMVWINALVVSAGGQIIGNVEAGKNATPEIDSPAGDAAAEIVGGLARSSAAPPAMSTATELAIASVKFSSRAGWVGPHGSGRDGHGQCLDSGRASGCPHARTLMGWHARSGRNSPHPRSGGRSEGPAPS
jgi:multiple sugar transport system substrate-binding protein